MTFCVAMITTPQSAEQRKQLLDLRTNGNCVQEGLRNECAEEALVRTLQLSEVSRGRHCGLELRVERR